MSFSDRTHTIWAYGVEIIATALIYVLLVVTFGSDSIAERIIEQKPELMTVLGLALGTSGVLFASFIAVLCTDFGKQLRLSGAAKDYAIALAWPPFAIALAMFSLMEVTKSVTGVAVKLALLSLIYSLINCVTLIKNVIGIISVWQDVDRARHSGRSS